MPTDSPFAPFTHDPTDLTPDDGRKAIAAGIVRLRDRSALPRTSAPQKFAESAPRELSCRPGVGVTVHGG